MLKMTNIVKDYQLGDETVHALRGISLDFRDNEFVSILGPSGCGKTTLLNIIGGLDRYTSGDLIINGTSTKKYADSDWDSYRNHSIGFVFQTYNLIPHQTVLNNVELAMTVSGVGKSERQRRAIEALEKVGLGNQIHKKPNQLSGGQMQRVAIARSLVNNPDILLADEPTGALDSVTSVQIMDILKEVAKDRLVIMVTHNAELAQEYSTRIISLKDGEIIGDTNPVAPEELEKQDEKPKGRQKKPSLSFFTALNLSLRNLLTKRGRTLLVSFAGSIGIIGIALILSLSNGITIYINRVQEDTLSAYPIELEKTTRDYAQMMSSFLGRDEEAAVKERDPDRIYVNSTSIKMVNAMNATAQNDLRKFYAYMQEHMTELEPYLTDVQYTYDLDFQMYSEDGKTQINPSTVFDSLGMPASMTASGMASGYFNAISEMLNNQDLLKMQYDCIAGHWPEEWNEIVLVVNKNNTIANLALYMLGLRDQSELAEQFEAAMSQQDVEIKDEDRSFSYDELLDLTFYIVPQGDFYSEGTETYYEGDVQKNVLTDIRSSKDYDQAAFVQTHGIPIKISGILRPSDSGSGTSINTLLAYSHKLTEHMFGLMKDSDVAKRQLESKKYDITTGLEFDEGQYKNLTDAQKVELFNTYLERHETVKASIMLDMLSQMTDEEMEQLVKDKLASMSRTEKDQKLTDSAVEIWTEMPQTAKKLALAMVRSSDTPMPPQVIAQMEAMDPEQVIQMMSNMGYNLSDEDITPEAREQFNEACAKISDEDMDDILGDVFSYEIETNSIEEFSKQYTTEELILMFDARYATMTEAEKAALYDKYMPSMVTKETYEEVLLKLGYVDLDSPATISLYAKDFNSKDRIADFITAYNESVPEAEKITYTDLVKLMMSSITTIINAISYVLIAFVSISLVVSSIMIGIITYISVLERTKEIGVLRAIGASKWDVGSVFNAETVIVGLFAGLIGIGLTLLLCIPMNIIIRALSGIPSLGAKLPWAGALILIGISILLTLIAGLIPSRLASKKDPVIALRTE